ncbi:MAG: ribosome maturation factor RimM [Spirochaetaceae bacterium]|jgi:16S rRNA processing protein RimM|nr:ribosome maturation factor RimM [Spirochaetaceae bacterium]
MSNDPGLFVTAIVGQPFGVEGFQKLSSLSGEFAHLLQLSSVLIRCAGCADKRYEIASFKQHGGALLVKFKGIDTPEDAKKLRGAALVVERKDAVPLTEGEFYIEELKGIPVTDESGGVQGEISDIIEGGGGFLAEIRLPDGEKRLVPFRNEFFGEVSAEKKTAILLNTWILE